MQWCFPFSGVRVSLGARPRWVLGASRYKQDGAVSAWAALGSQAKYSAQAFRWWPKPEGLLTEPSPWHHTPPPDMPGKTRKQGSMSRAILLPRTLTCADPTGRTPKSAPQRRQPSCYGVPSLCPWCPKSSPTGKQPCCRGGTRVTTVCLMKWSDHMERESCKGKRASDSTVPPRGHLHAVALTLPLINFIFQLTAQAGKWSSSTQFTVKQRGKPVHRARALLGINSIWRSKRGVFNFALSSFLISTIFCASCYQTEQKAELIGKKLTSGVEAGNIISQTGG